MFYVRHHDDQVSMFNSKCHSVVLLNHIRKSLNCPGHIDLLLQQPEYKNAIPVGINEKPEMTYANTYLGLRASYILLQVQDDEDGVKEYTVMWKSRGDESDKVAAALEAKMADEKKKAGGKQKGKK